MLAVSRLMRSLPAMLVALAVAGCGFQLRSSMSLPFDTVYIDGMPYSQFTSELKRGISGSSDTRIVDARESARAVVSLMGETQERGILTVSAGGRVRELQLRYRVTFRVDKPAGGQWLPRNEVVILRDMTYDDTQILAKEGEAQTLFREMQSDAVRQVLRRIQAIRAMSEVDEG